MFPFKESHGSLLLKIKDNSIKIKVQAGAGNDRTLKSPLKFLFPWTLPKTANGKPIPRTPVHFRCSSLAPLGSRTILTTRNKLEVISSWDKMGKTYPLKIYVITPHPAPHHPHHSMKYQEKAEGLLCKGSCLKLRRGEINHLFLLQAILCPFQLSKACSSTSS